MACEPRLATTGNTPLNGRTLGIVLFFGSALSVGFMFFHPFVHAHSTAEFVAKIAQGALVNGIVHGTLIALMGVLACGFSGLSTHLGSCSLAVRGGMVAYVMGAAAMTAAALISGFVIPEYVSRYQARPTEDLEIMRHVLSLCRDINQVCSRMGVLATSAAFVLWSIPLIRRGGWSRVIGAVGLLGGTALAVTLLAGYLPMNVHGMLAFVIVQAAWSIGVGVLLIRREI